MSNDNVFEFKNSGVVNAVRDTLTEVPREGARDLLVEAVEAEVAELLGQYRSEQDRTGRARMVRNGYLPARAIQTGIGDVPVKAPRVRDRAGQVRFSSSILPAYLRRTQTIEEWLPWRYLKGIPRGDFRKPWQPSWGATRRGCHPARSAPLEDRLARGARPLGEAQPGQQAVVVPVGSTGFTLASRLEEANQCILGVIGATPEGKKERVALSDGFHESEQSWKEVLMDLKQRGLKIDPKLAIGDGALGLKESASAGVWVRTRAALLGAQNRQRAQ